MGESDEARAAGGAPRCTTHFQGCDCREWAHAAEVAALRAEVETLRGALRPRAIWRNERKAYCDQCGGSWPRDAAESHLAGCLLVTTGEGRRRVAEQRVQESPPWLLQMAARLTVYSQLAHDRLGHAQEWDSCPVPLCWRDRYFIARASGEGEGQGG